MSGNKFLQVFDGLVPGSINAALLVVLGQPRWSWGHRSHNKDRKYFWKMDLDDEPATIELWNTLQEPVEKAIGNPLEILRIYANGHTFGLGGSIHYDEKEPDTFTALYYPMPKWLPEWEGETFFYRDDMSSTVAVIMPKPGRLVVFDARMPHSSTMPSRDFYDLRVTIAFKLRIKQGR